MTAKIRIGLVISGLLTAALVTWWSWYQSTVANPYRPDHLIRFHVIANSDSAADQALKFRVRDVIVQAMAPRFRQAKNIEEAREIAQANLGYMEQLAKQEICAAGKDYPVAVYLGHFQFPEKTYHLATAGTPGERTSLTLPAGEYEAVRVVIGRGTGANWWCVLFPPLCFVNLQNPMPDKKTPGSAVNVVESPGQAALLQPEGVAGQDSLHKADGFDAPERCQDSQPAFKWAAPPAVATLAPAHRSGERESDGFAITTSSPGGTRVEFRLRILDFFSRSEGWFSHIWGYKSKTAHG